MRLKNENSVVGFPNFEMQHLRMKTKKHNFLCNFASLFLTSNLMQFGKVNLLFVRKHLGRIYLKSSYTYRHNFNADCV